MIKRGVVPPINVGGDDITDLNAHVVKCSRDRARAHGARVARGPGHKDGVAVGIAEQDGDEGKGAPGIVHGTGPPSECDYTWQCPYALQHGYEGPFAHSLAEPCEA